jgi:hypothetical protein
MSGHWGTQTQRRRVLFAIPALLILLAGCEYSGPAEGPTQSSTQGATAPPRSLKENLDEVARLLDASTTDPGMPSEAAAAGKLSTVLAPGDYTVTAACAGVYGAKLTIVRGEGHPEATELMCNATLERFLRHTGGPITISAVPATGSPAAAGLTLKPNTDPQASALEDMVEWASQKLTPELPRQTAGSTASNSSTGFGLSAEPGTYELHFVCDGPPTAELSASTWAGAEVLAAVQVNCDGDVFKATVQLGTEGVDLKMNPGSGQDARYAFRLVPSA